MSYREKGDIRHKFQEGDIVYNEIWEDHVLVLFEEEETYFVCEVKWEFKNKNYRYSINPKNHYHLPKSEIIGICKETLSYVYVDHFLRKINGESANKKYRSLDSDNGSPC